MTLAEILDRAAADLDAVERVEVVNGVEWRRTGRAFAALSGSRAEFRLPAIVGRAALGTPSTSGSERGAEWVALAPPDLDRMAMDRAVAWFVAAWRHVVD